ncbi:kicstor complex protein kaptin [Anaeramoeba ignava]|uniref:Kicstor complex protein kaptin n=1 Tax=Anaeramoeba ignava TaxID=1746090 RepID=A0A9Q0RFD5_ANAIG|nr:kicstor complex protein kaptin [Anaeramoeba ignava]
MIEIFKTQHNGTTNIYGQTLLRNERKIYPLLASRNKILIFQFNEIKTIWESSIFFKSRYEIIAISCFKKIPYTALITSKIKKGKKEKPKFSLIILKKNLRNMEKETEQEIILSFTPIFLSSFGFDFGFDCEFFLISDDNSKIHIFEMQQNMEFHEKEIKKGFLYELTQFKSPVINLIMRELKDKRITIAGCQNGLLHLFITQIDYENEAKKETIIHESEGFLNGPVSCLQMIIPKSKKSKNISESTLNQIIEDNKEKQEKITKRIHLLISDTIESVLLLKNININGIPKFPFESSSLILKSSLFDSVTCMHLVHNPQFMKKSILFVGTFIGLFLVFQAKLSAEEWIEKKELRTNLETPIFSIRSFISKIKNQLIISVATDSRLHFFQINIISKENIN